MVLDFSDGILRRFDNLCLRSDEFVIFVMPSVQSLTAH